MFTITYIEGKVIADMFNISPEVSWVICQSYLSIWRGHREKITIDKFYLTLIYLSGKNDLQIEEKINEDRSLSNERLSLITT